MLTVLNVLFHSYRWLRAEAPGASVDGRRSHDDEANDNENYHHRNTQRNHHPPPRFNGKYRGTVAFKQCPVACDQYYKLFTAGITPLAAYFSMILTELRR
jgi:hypothetical protein